MMRYRLMMNSRVVFGELFSEPPDPSFGAQLGRQTLNVEIRLQAAA